MLKKCLAAWLVFVCALFMAGCAKKDTTVNQNVRTLVHGFQQSMVTFFEIKNLQDSSLLLTQVNDNLKKIEDSKKKLGQVSGLAENISDDKIKAEVQNFIGLGREREKLALRYLDDIRRDLDYRIKNPDAQVNVNAYIVNIPNRLLDLEYQSEQSVQRLDKLLSKK